MRRTDTAQIELRDDGIVLVRINARASQGMNDAVANLDAAIEATRGAKRPLCVDISRCEPVSAEVRHFYSGRILDDKFTALGLCITATPFGRMMGNVYLRVARPGIPARLFSDEGQAFDWLKGYR